MLTDLSDQEKRNQSSQWEASSFTQNPEKPQESKSLGAEIGKIISVSLQFGRKLKTDSMAKTKFREDIFKRAPSRAETPY